MNSSKCSYCEKEFIGRAVGGHMVNCELNPKSPATRAKVLHSLSSRVNPATIPGIREKISRGVITYLEKNPDKVPYLRNHSSRESNPERVFREGLIERGIVGWEAKFRNGIYEYDFAFPLLKLDVEIDGGTHQLEWVKLKDRQRDIY